MNNIKRIYYDGSIDKDNILTVLKVFSSDIEYNLKTSSERFEVYNSKNLESFITDSNRAFNEKRTPNPLRTIIKLKAGITLNSPILLQTSSESDVVKKDLEKIKSKLELINSHKTDINLLIDLLVYGVAFGYTLADKDLEKSIMFGKFSPTNTTFIQSNDIGNKTLLVINKSKSIKIINDNKVETTVYTCFDDKNKYILSVEDGQYELLDFSRHSLPSNPVTVYECNEDLIPLFDEELPLLTSYMLASSNLDNDMLNKINNLLAIIGFELSDESMKKIFYKETNILAIPPNQNGENGNKDVKFVSSSANMQDMMNYKSSLWQEMLDIAFLPKDAGERAETGQAMKFGGNYVVTSIMCAMEELNITAPKLQEINNMIAILKARGELSSEIKISDIKIAYDQNRLLDIRELAETMEILSRVGMAIDDILDICGVATNNIKIENGFKETQMVKNKIQAILNDKVLTSDEKLDKINVIYNAK